MGDAVTAVFGKCNLPTSSQEQALTSPSAEGPRDLLLGKRANGELRTCSHSHSQPPFPALCKCSEGLESGAPWGQEPSPGSERLLYPGRLKSPREAGTQRLTSVSPASFSAWLMIHSPFVSPWGLLLPFSLASLQLPARSLDSELC